MPWPFAGGGRNLPETFAELIDSALAAAGWSVVANSRIGRETIIALGRNVHLRVSTNALKSVDQNGDLGAYLLKAKADVLSPRAAGAEARDERKVESRWRWRAEADSASSG